MRTNTFTPITFEQMQREQDERAHKEAQRAQEEAQRAEQRAEQRAQQQKRQDEAKNPVSPYATGPFRNGK